MAKSPKFDDPPVVETVLGVQFPEIEGFRAAHFGLYWQTIKSDYPRPDDRPRLDSVRERFPRVPVIPGPPLKLLEHAPTNRSWFADESESRLIQLQPNRFHYNWRQRRGEEYTSYEENSRRFLQAFDNFSHFCRDHNLPEPAPELCEITYVNHIDPVDGESAIDLAGKVFNGLCWETTDGFLTTPESCTLNRAYVIDQRGKQVGRLYAEASIAVRRTDSQLREFILFKLTARVNHPPEATEGFKDTLQLAHDWVVFGFADLTDASIQKDRWRRTQ